jgi:prolyl oligopeptidase
MKKMLLLCMLSMMMALLLSCGAKDKPAPRITYPVTAKADQVDDYHGTQVSDPYRWLENDRAPEVEKWVTDQNQVTFDYLAKIPYRQDILKRLQALYNYPRYGMPFRVGDYYFFSKNDGLQNQSVTYYQKGLDGEAEVFLDPNTLSADGTVRASLMGESQDKRYMAISRGESGSDWSEIRVMEIATRQELPDRLKWVKFSGAAWHGDGFFYSRYDAPKEGAELSQQNSEQKVYYHKLGEDQEKDQLVYADPAHPLRYYGAGVTEDKNYLILSISEGTHGSEILFKDLREPKSEFSVLCPGFESDYAVVTTVGDRFIVHTNQGAPNYRVVQIEPQKPEKENWTDLVKEGPDVMESASAAGGKLFVRYLRDVTSRIDRHALTGEKESVINLPALGSAYGFYGELTDTEVFYSFNSFTYPPTIYRYKIADGSSELFRKTEVTFDPQAYETKQVFFESKDKTRVPMFLVYKKGLEMDGARPTYLYAYGGFNASMTPGFNPGNIPLLEQGGVYAMANIRGGGEYGESWHQAGMLDKKQNVFDDFIAAAEYLIREKITSKDYLAIAGGSNGGLLVGAVMTQRPDLFKVALPAVGVMDMLRYHKFTVGWGWAVEYGSSDHAEHFKFLYAYSPLHTLKAGTAYPATLVTTADHDDRVVPAHSFKFIAALQAAHSGPNPVLIRIETKSGHGASSLTKALEGKADSLAFMFHTMGVAYKPVQ